MLKLFAATSLSLSMAATAASAQSSDEPDRPVGLDAAVVTANRVPARLSEVASSITLITAADIARRQETTLSDLLKEAPGLDLLQAGGPGGQTSVFVRGTNANHVKVIVDGVDVSDPASPAGAVDLGRFLTADVARVEVLRGPQSGLYGSDAIGGVINVVTKAGEGPPRATATLEGGSFATFNQAAGLSGAAGRFHYAADIAHLHAGATPVTPLDLLAPGERRNDDAYDNLTVSTKLSYDATKDLELGLTARYVNAQLRFTGDDFTTGFPDVTQSKSDTRQYDVRGTVRLSSFGARFVQTFGAAYDRTATSDASPESPTSFSAGERAKLDWQGEVRLARGETLVLGAEHEHDAISRPLAARMSIDSGYAELISNPMKDLNYTVSVRYDANSGFGGKFTYRFAPTYFIQATRTKLKASVGAGFKAPTLSQRFQDFPSFGFSGNPGLKPETSTGYDIGFEQSLLKDGRLSFGATWWRNTIRNLIEDNATFTSYANIGRAHTQGVESFVAFSPARTVAVRLDYTFTDAEDDLLKQTLLRRPRDKWSLEARWRPITSLSLDATLLSSGRWIDGNRTFTIPRLIAPGYTTVDLAASYAVTDHVAISGRVSNLFDERYESPVGFLRPGRGVFAGVQATL
jgi:vitamin B12 transporter